MLSITGFIVSSALCGVSWTLGSMVLFRLAQGICGAPLVPLSQAILLNPALLPYQSALGSDIEGAGSIAGVARELGRQAEMQAFNDLFWFIGWVMLAILPLLLLMKRSEAKGIVIV